MKKKTKKRIELLELAIKAALKRMEQLSILQDSDECLLCMNMSIFDGCDNCPAQKSKFSCDEYGLIIDHIQGELMEQAKSWKKEIERLKKT